jgi:putative Mn2+ efflux pump MntP
MAYLRELLQDPLFMRVCMFLWGLPFVGISVYALASWHPVETYEWFGAALLCALGLLGFYLLGIATMGSKARLEKSTDFIHDGGDILGLVLVVAIALVAIPVAVVLRVIARGRRA